MEKQAGIASNKVAPPCTDEVLEVYSKPEDLDSFNPLEPPPLDWRSDSSSEACSLRDAEEPRSFSMDAPLEELSHCGALSTSFTLTEGENLTSQALEDLTNQKVEACANNAQRINECNVPNPLEIHLEKTKPKSRENNQQHDLDHSHIQGLLNQLQLFHPAPPSKDPVPEPEPEKSTFVADHAIERHLSSSCLVPDISAHQTCSVGSPVSGLLFTMSHQKELLELLEDPEPQETQEFQESQEEHPNLTEEIIESRIENISQLSDCQTRYITRSGQADEMVSVSYGSDIWHSPFQDEFMMSGYSEDEVSGLGPSKLMISDELACHGADVVGETLVIVQKLESIKHCHCENLYSFLI